MATPGSGRLCWDTGNFRSSGRISSFGLAIDNDDVRQREYCGARKAPSERPVFTDIPITSSAPPPRRSASISSVLALVEASNAAKLAATVLLPSPGGTDLRMPMTLHC